MKEMKIEIDDWDELDEESDEFALNREIPDPTDEEIELEAGVDGDSDDFSFLKWSEDNDDFEDDELTETSSLNDETLYSSGDDDWSWRP